MKVTVQLSGAWGSKEQMARVEVGLPGQPFEGVLEGENRIAAAPGGINKLKYHIVTPPRLFDKVLDKRVLEEPIMTHHREV